MNEPKAERVATTHESLVALLRDMPDAALLRIVCPLIDLDPAEVAHVAHFSSSIEILSHLKLRRARRFIADLVLDLRTHSGARIRVVILEVQLSLDLSKIDSWPVMQPAFGLEAKVGTRTAATC